MSLETYQGIVKNGQIHFSNKVELPEEAKVYVVVADEKESPKQKFDLAEMAARMPKNYKPHEEDFGKPVGKEVWKSLVFIVFFQLPLAEAISIYTS